MKVKKHKNIPQETWLLYTPNFLNNQKYILWNKEKKTTFALMISKKYIDPFCVFFIYWVAGVMILLFLIFLLSDGLNADNFIIFFGILFYILLFIRDLWNWDITLEQLAQSKIFKISAFPIAIILTRWVNIWTSFFFVSHKTLILKNIRKNKKLFQNHYKIIQR